MHENYVPEARFRRLNGFGRRESVEEEDRTLSRVSLAVCAALLSVLAAAAPMSFAKKPEPKTAIQTPTERPVTEAEKKEIDCLADGLVAALDEQAVCTIIWNSISSTPLSAGEFARITEQKMNPAFKIAAKNIAEYIVGHPRFAIAMAAAVRTKLDTCGDFRAGIATLMPDTFPHADLHSSAFLTQLENQ